MSEKESNVPTYEGIDRRIALSKSRSGRNSNDSSMGVIIGVVGGLLSAILGIIFMVIFAQMAALSAQIESDNVIERQITAATSNMLARIVGLESYNVSNAVSLAELRVRIEGEIEILVLWRLQVVPLLARIGEELNDLSREDRDDQVYESLQELIMQAVPNVSIEEE